MSYKIPYQNTNSFSKLVLDYLNHDEKLKPFVNYFPDLKNFAKQVAEKQAHQIDRGILVEVLKRQNANLILSANTQENISLLELDTSFTVTTGHQICLFSGPLYFMYKIISVLSLCEQLNLKYPTNNFVPVFWMATEDHDFEEVNHIHLFSKKIKWETKQTGSVGKINLNGFQSVISELKSSLGSYKNIDKLIAFIEDAYLNHDNLADATRYFVNELFGKHGLVIIDGDNKDLKRQFVPQMKKDILQNSFIGALNECSMSLAKNYKAQAFIRDINFFRLSEGKRELIKGNVTEREIEENPEQFSPNVLLRPLYQEIVLPNIAYVGGESEIAYWMQLKMAFCEEKIPFPLLVLRNSALLINQKQQDKFKKLGFELDDLFLSEDELNKRYVLAHSNMEISLENEKRDVILLYQKIASKNSDLSLENSIKAQLQKQLSAIDNLQEKFIRAEKKRSKTAINQIAKIKKQLFPNNALQERHYNFIPYYLEYGDNFIKTLKNNFNPLIPNFVVLNLKN